MGTFGTILGVALCVGLLAYIGVSVAKIIISIRDRKNLNDEPDNGECTPNE